MDLTERQIIAACQSGNLEMFVSLYDAYVEKIYKFLFFRTFSKEQAEDLTSQVFLQAMSKIGTFQEGRGTFQAWLFQIARNLLIDEYRRKKPTEDLEAHYDLASAVNLEQETNAKLEAEAVIKLIQRLPEEAQELITMRLWQDLSYAEIAAVTGKSEGSLKMQFSRLISKLKSNVN
jgi:RNA polymerase sigma-70 factor, ECF subfamily